MVKRRRVAEWLLHAGVMAALVGLAVRSWLQPHSRLGVGDLLLGPVVVMGALATYRFYRRERDGAQKEAALQHVLDTMCDAVIVVGADRRIVQSSGRAKELFGYTEIELIGRPLAELLPDWSPFPADWPSAVRGALSEETLPEFAGRMRDGTPLALEIAMAPITGSPAAAVQLLIRDVSRAKQVRDDLRATEAHLRQIVEQMPAILWTTDANLKITSTVGAGLAALNVEPAELIGLNMPDTLRRDDLHSAPVSAHMRALRGESLSQEMVWKDRSFQVRVDPLRNPERRISGTIGIVLDVTDHKHTVNELKARLRQQAAIATLGRHALAGISFDTLLEEAVQAVRETLEVDLCEVIEACPDGTVLKPRAKAGWGADERAVVPAGADSPAALALRSGAPVSVADFQIDPRFPADPLAQSHGVVSSMSVVIQRRGRSFGVLSAHARRKRPFTEDDRNFLHAAAHVLAAALDREEADATQNRLVALLEATTDGVAIADVDHRLLYVNGAGRDMLGLADQADLSQCRLVDFYPEELRSRFLHEIMPAALRQGAWNGEIDLQGPGGHRRSVSQVVLAHRSPEGRVDFLSTVARDLGERLRLEEQLRQAQKMEAVGRLAGGVAHDFNNLLCIIAGYTEMALSQSAIGASLATFLGEISKACNRAATLTRQLLAFSRKSLLTPKVLDVNDVIHDAGAMLRRLIGEDIELATVLEPGLPPVKADPNQLEQVLMNLVVNARDAMPQGGRLELRTACVSLGDSDVRDQPEVSPGSYVLLAVRDTGCGMDEETRARIFEPFFTTKGIGKGTGLGLAMVYGTVKQSGGHIDVETAVGRGTTFNVYLPAISSAQRDVTLPAMLRDAPVGTETVLLAEDEDAVRALVLQVLRHSGYTVLEARDGEEALAVGESHSGPIHLLLTDVVMPRLGGGRLARRFTRNRPETRVLFMSGFADSTLVRHDVVSGEADCLMKPFSPEVLARKVRETLDAAVAN